MRPIDHHDPTGSDKSVKPLLLLLSVLFSTGICAEVREQAVDYQAGDTHMKGYLAWDSSKGDKQPGILVVHEWWGLNQYARKRARMLAELGYTALAVDMYGDGKTTEHPKEAATFMNGVAEHADLARERFLAAKTLLQKQPSVDPDAIAAIGYCFGGATVLDMARQGVDLKAVVSFHGSLNTTVPAKRGLIKSRILVLSGAEDSFITPQSIDAFKQEMENASVRYEFVNYPGAKHSFTNPDADRYGKAHSLPLAYNAKADHESWQAMRELLLASFGR